MTGTAANGTSYLDSVGRVEGLDVTAYMRDDIYKPCVLQSLGKS